VLKYLTRYGVAAGIIMGLAALGVVWADEDDSSPREQHRSVVLGLSGGSTAAVEAEAGDDVVRIVTQISSQGSSAGVQVAGRGAPRANTPAASSSSGGVGSSTSGGAPRSSLCPGQSCETLADGSLRIIQSGPAGGATWFTAPAGVPVTGWTAVGGWHVNTGAVAGELVQEVRLPGIVVRANPGQGVVAVPTWYWVEGYAGETLGDSRTVTNSHDECRTVLVPGPNGGPPIAGRECRTVTDSTTVAVRVEPTDYEWSFGDGSSYTAQDAHGLGTPFRGLDSPSPVQHVYEYSSFGFDDGFPIRLVVRFATRFQIDGGPWQRLSDVSRTYTGTYVVRQIEPLRVSIESGPSLTPSWPVRRFEGVCWWTLLDQSRRPCTAVALAFPSFA